MLERPATDPGSLPSLSFVRETGHKIAEMTRGAEAPRAFDYGSGAERVSDGRFTYEFDARGRLIKATEQLLPTSPSSLSLRRVHYDYSATGRVVGRRAEYARLASASTPPLETDWKLEDRPEILDEDALPAETTFVWDAISDQLVSIHRADDGTLLRQIIHGGNGYDDPIEVAAITATSGVGRLYPIFDEAGAGTLQAIVNEQGEVVSRTIAEGAYGEDEFGLAGAAVDQIAVTATKDGSGALEKVEVTIRVTEALDAATVATGARLAVVDPGTGAVVRSATATPSLIDNETATLRWTLTGAEWTALVADSASEPHSLSIAVTSTLRAAAWGDENGILPATTTALHTSPDLPVELLEPLSTIVSWMATLPPSTPRTTTLFTAPALSALAAAGPPKTGRVVVAAGFQALPFTEPATGLIYARARWYDPSTGTFLSPDPLGYQDSSNLYAFCGGDPVNCSDPTGEWGLKDAWNQVKENTVFTAGLLVGAGETVINAVNNLNPVVGTVNRVRAAIPRAKRVAAAYRAGGAGAAASQYGAEVKDYVLHNAPIVSTIVNGQGIADTYYREGAFAAGRHAGGTWVAVTGDALAIYAGGRAIQAPSPAPSATSATPTRVFHADPAGNTIVASPDLPVNAQGGRVVVPEGHVLSNLDPAFAEPSIVRRGPFTAQQRAGFLRGNAGGTRIAPHHRGQAPVQYGGVIDELPGPAHPEGNLHTTGNRHPNPSMFNNMEGGTALRKSEIRAHWRAKGQRLVEVEPGVWIDPNG